MRKILLILPILLSGCANFTFDPVEFNNMVTIKEVTNTAYTQCGAPEVKDSINDIKKLLDHQLLYSSYRESRSVEFNVAIINLKEIADGLYASYTTSTPSVGYCQEKIKLIGSGSSAITRILGRL